MAVNDPTASVPTPTGVLQGAAVFSWDGSTWQPAGRVGPSVATPTGVLTGVAPFSWSGGWWQPYPGRSGPGAPTPSGTLEGIALYTWNGSAWVPPGGGPGCATPSGTLRGVAGFYWDGTAWQPSGQAGPDVATPYGVLQGMAMFSPSGTAWAPTVSPAALDLNFVTMTTLDPSVTFTRASTATYFDANGVMQTAAANAARLDNDPVTHAPRGLLIEEARTNVLLNSATLGTQSVAVTAQAYTLSFYRTGTVTMSGAFAGSLVGTGAFPTRVSQTFTAAAGTLTLTVTGSVLNAQLEAGAFPTSYIPTTSAAVTRAADVALMSVGSWFNAAGIGSIVAEFSINEPQFGNQMLYDMWDGTHNSEVITYLNATQAASTVEVVGSVRYQATPSVSATPGAIYKHGMSWSATAGAVYLNGSQLNSSAATGAGPTAPTQLYLGVWGGGTQFFLDGYIRRFRYWPRALSNTELQQVTT